jgi:hypothetical protein
MFSTPGSLSISRDLKSFWSFASIVTHGEPEACESATVFRKIPAKPAQIERTFYKKMPS